MTQKILGRSGVPSPFMRGNWVYTLECGHLYSLILAEPEATQALKEWGELFILPKGQAGPAIQKWFNETSLIPKTVDCKSCDPGSIKWEGFEFYKDENTHESS